jgi:hypothetical protein
MVWISTWNQWRKKFNNKFRRKGLTDYIDNYRNNKHHNQFYAIEITEKKNKTNSKHAVNNVHYISQFDKEEINLSTDLNNFWLPINNFNQCVKLNDNTKLEKEINFLRSKVNKFEIFQQVTFEFRMFKIRISNSFSQ